MGTEVFTGITSVDTSNYWCFLQKNTEIQGHLCRGDGHDFMTSFYSNGQLRYCELSENITIEGKLYRGKNAVRYKPDGTIIIK